MVSYHQGTKQLKQASILRNWAATEFERTRITVGAGLSTGEALQAGLLSEVMGTLARQTLYLAEASQLGVTFTREMQKTAISREPAFRDENGSFLILDLGKLLLRQV